MIVTVVLLAAIAAGLRIAGAIARLVALVLMIVVVALVSGATTRLGPLETHGQTLIERVQSVRVDGSGIRRLASRVGGVLGLGEDSEASAGARVLRAVDGDTLVVRVGGREERVRVLGIDTPETVKPGAAVGCYGRQASSHAKAWAAEHRSVRLDRDQAAPDRDRYGRLLRYVGPAGGGRDLSAEQVRGGYARVAAYGQQLARLPQLRRAEQRARNARRGLWGACR